MLIALSMIAFTHNQAQTPGFEWAKQVEGVGGGSIASDPAGNQVLTGSFSGTVDFDPGSGTLYLTSAGEGDIFIQKLDGNGNLLWASSMGDIYNDSGGKVVTDASGNIYIIGSFKGTIDADPGPGVCWLIAPNKSTALVLKLEPDGDLIWARQFGDGESGYSGPGSIAIDNNLNVITVGRFIGTIDFDPGPAVYNLSSSTTDNVGDDFIHKMDASGNFTWVGQLKGKNFHYIHSVVSDGSGGIYYCGGFWGTVDFDPSVKGKYNLTAGGGWMNSFIGKLTANGNFVWAKQIYSAESQNYSHSLALDPSEDLYVAGDFGGTCDFDPGSGVFNMTAAGGGDAHILKLNSSGGFLWAKQIGDGSADIKTDAGGNVYVSGGFANTSDFDPGNGTYLLTSNGIADGYIFKGNSSGNLLWVIQTGGTGLDGGGAMAVDVSGYIYGTGGFSDIVDFNPDGNGIFEMTNAGEPDLYIQKLNPAGGSNCPIPDGLNVTNIGETSATLGWNAVSGATGYYVRYRVVQTVDWTTSGLVTRTSLILDNLTVATGYEFRVKTDCESNYSYAFEFLTLGGGCIDNYEPNESPATAVPMAVNSELYALIGSATDHDWFSFSTTSTAKNIKITLTNLPADYALQLCRPDGIPLANSNNPGTTDEIILYNPRKSGSYTIHVSGSGGVYDPINCYTLNLEVSGTQYKSAVADIKAGEVANSLVTYPNPASNTLYCDITSAAAGSCEAAMLNTSCQVVLHNYFKVSEGNNHITMDVSTIPNGLYMIRLVNNDEIITHKVMIVH